MSQAEQTNSEDAVHPTAGADAWGHGTQGPAVRAGRTIETRRKVRRLSERGTLPIEEGNEERVLQRISIIASRVECDVGQATKGAQWMPWQHGPKKGVVRLR